MFASWLSLCFTPFADESSGDVDGRVWNLYIFHCYHVSEQRLGDHGFCKMEPVNLPFSFVSFFMIRREGWQLVARLQCCGLGL